MKRFLLTLVAAAAMLVFASPAVAATGQLFGGATAENGSVKLVSDLSDSSTTNDFSGIDWKDLAIKFEDLKTLSTQYNVTDDDCGGGSPRFQLNIDGKNVFVYLGPAPNFTGCAQNQWLSSGNLIGSTDGRFDLSQLGGSQNATYAQALEFLRGKTITGIQLVADAGWFFADKEQTVLVRNVMINNQTFYGTTPSRAKVNAAKLCKAERARMGTAAFNELWGTNGNDRNAYGKCVSTVSKAKGTQTHQQILAAIAACQARGLKGAALGACVAAGDNVAATLTEAQEKAAAAKSNNGKGKGRR